MSNMQEKICLLLRSVRLIDIMKKTEKNCYVCGKQNLTTDEVGLTKKLLDKNTDKFYCLSCLAEYLEVTEEELLAKIEEFKMQGCTLFK